MSNPLLFGCFVSVAVLITFVAIGQFTGRRKDPIEARLAEYGGQGRALREIPVEFDAGEPGKWRGLNRRLAGMGWASKLGRALVRADVPLTVAEYVVLMLSLAMMAFSLGFLLFRSGLLGLMMALVAAIVPLYYLRLRRVRRQKAMTAQIPEILTLLVGGLRAGYGLSQSMGIIVERLPPPASTEFARAVRAVGFGLPIQRALTEMADRVDVDDLELVTTAINVQYELGGNLAQTLDTIGQTVRDRLRIFREIRTLTAHQRLTSYILAAEPLAIALLLFVITPTYIGRLFAPEPPWIRILPIMAVIMVAVGFMIIRRIANINV